jgi:hypothetical protein
MKLQSELKHQAKGIRYSLRRARTGLRWGSSELSRMPVVIGNSMPKSGSHLIIQILEELTKIGPFVDPGFPPLNRDEENNILSTEKILQKISALKSGDITYCYLPGSTDYLRALSAQRCASLFIYRDPRDMIVSHVFYATDMHAGHQMHKYYNEVLTSMEERINAAINGVNQSDLKLTPILQKYENYFGWLGEDKILSLRFEDLILDRVGSVKKILSHLEIHGFKPEIGEDRAIEILKDANQPGKSGTFRKGQPGNWKEHFTSENIDLFKEKTGDLLIRLGYESSQEW